MIFKQSQVEIKLKKKGNTTYTYFDTFYLNEIWFNTQIKNIRLALLNNYVQ